MPTGTPTRTPPGHSPVIRPPPSSSPTSRRPVSTELGVSDDPRALVPGDPVAVAVDARVLADRAAELARTGEALRRIGTGAWSGPAADTWREHHAEDAVRWLQAGDSLDAAARALSGHADALAQAEAARAVDLWRSGDVASAEIARQVAAGAVAPPIDPGDEAQRGAGEVLAAARAELQRSGDQVASVLRGEAALAPRDSQKQTDADFYGGIWDSLSGAAEGAWALVSDPAEAVAGVVQAAAHPLDTVQDAIAYDDWRGDPEPRALGRNTGDLILGAATIGAGKIASTLGRETRIAGESEPDPDEPGSVPERDVSPEIRRTEVESAVIDPSGTPLGVEDSKRVHVVDEQRLNAVRADLMSRLGQPDIEHALPNGRVETWTIDPEAGTTVTYRTFSSSGGATIDINLGRDFPVKRLHVREDGS